MRSVQLYAEWGHTILWSNHPKGAAAFCRIGRLWLYWQCSYNSCRRWCWYGVQCIDVSRHTSLFSAACTQQQLVLLMAACYLVHVVVIASSCSSSAASCFLYCALQHGCAPCSLLNVGHRQSTLVTMLLSSYLCCSWLAASVATESCRTPHAPCARYC